jgi:hypothetical protein
MAPGTTSGHHPIVSKRAIQYWSGSRSGVLFALGVRNAVE